MFLLVFLPLCVLGNTTTETVPFFHGHVFENSAPGSRVNGLSVPIKRLNSDRLCSPLDSAAAAVAVRFFKLTGDGSQNFRFFAHHKRGHVLLKTSRVLDREKRAEYALTLVARCAQDMGEEEEQGGRMLLAQMAHFKVVVLDTNDHQPTFPSSFVTLRVDDATPLRTAVYTMTACDADSGKNAQLTYFAEPRNGSFYVVPKTGDILLVDSILGRDEPIRFRVFARDRGCPPRISHSVTVAVDPRQWPEARDQNVPVKAPERKSRSVGGSDSDGNVVLINVSEDAAVGSVLVNLNPVRFQSAIFELVEPEPVESDPVSVSRESGDVVISRRLDRETDPLVEVTVKVQDKRGERESE